MTAHHDQSCAQGDGEQEKNGGSGSYQEASSPSLPLMSDSSPLASEALRAIRGARPRARRREGPRPPPTKGRLRATWSTVTEGRRPGACSQQCSVRRQHRGMCHRPRIDNREIVCTRRAARPDETLMAICQTSDIAVPVMVEQHGDQAAVRGSRFPHAHGLACPRSDRLRVTAGYVLLLVLGWCPSFDYEL